MKGTFHHYVYVYLTQHGANICVDSIHAVNVLDLLKHVVCFQTNPEQ